MRDALYRILDNPRIFSLVQSLLGARRVYDAVQKHCLPLVEKAGGQYVLDVGCGTGSLRSMFSGGYYGIDIHFDYLSHARRATNSHFIQGNALALPVQSGIISLVFSFGLVHHLSEEQRGTFYEEVWRICEPGGTILIVDGLIPSQALNLPGYALAKLDRGPHKMRRKDFIAMIETAFPDAQWCGFDFIRLFPYELAFATIRK